MRNEIEADTKGLSGLRGKYLVGDNLDLLGLLPENSIDMIYFDPPYNTGRNFYNFNDKFASVQEYIDFMKMRVKECQRCLKPCSNMIIHVEPKISHHFRLICDEVFGPNSFKNEIVWQTGGNSKNLHQLNRFHDTLIVYAKKGKGKTVFNPIYFPYDDEYKKRSNVKICDHHRKEYVSTALHNSQPEVNPRPNLRYEWKGHSKQWYVTKEKMTELDRDERLVYNKRGIPRIKRFLDEMSGIPLRDIWCDISNTQIGEKLKYATQKPVKLLERIVDLYSNEGDCCLDIFAGSGTLGRACLAKNRDFILFDSNETGLAVFEESLQ